MKSGYIYVLVHPSDPNLFKVGQTTRHPKMRLAEHNSDFAKHAGRVVKETGQNWELKTYIAVPDTNRAESAFWGATHLADIPYLGGVEVQKMEWKTVEAGLKAAESAGVPPPTKPQPDYVYAYTAWMRKRLAGRDITLLGHVKSKISGRNNFRCSNGHEWRTIPRIVAEGEGCPRCGIGQRTSEQMWEVAKSGFLFLLVHPDKPGLIKIGLTYQKQEEWDSDDMRGGWTIHRYRYVEEPSLAESLIWILLGHPLPHDRGFIVIDLEVAERAIRKLHDREVEEIALIEKARESNASS
ncbi:GIY-YIG nuclease family protein [Afipia sp. DC4300-2b1]|uniref:GIY-YIG nuclease family protein n=1 Tax=Afipia sp. DC4300-2b1 TaxID=2804672 RepID=UPI003CF994C5